jgi:1-acyl-sn-glycerol-3-phosphate acyltransferase
MRLIDAVRILLVFALAAIVFTLPIMIGWMAPMRHRRKIFYWPWLIFARGVCIICRVDLRARGREHIQAGFHQRHLFICNHQSALDIPLLVSIYPLPFLTKRENLYIPFLGLAGLLAGSIAFNRDNAGQRRRVMEQIIDRASRHTSLFIFPEGTRSRNGELQPRVYPALLRLAWRARLDIVPIALHGSYQVVGQKPPASGRYPVFMDIGPAIEAEKFDNERAFADHCWQQVVLLHKGVARELDRVEMAADKKMLSAQS